MNKTNTVAYRTMICFSGLVLCISNCIFGADFEVDILSCPDELMPGIFAEVYAVAKNTSGHSLTFASPGSVLEIEVLREDGKLISPCKILHFSELVQLPPENWKGRVLEGNWSKEITTELCFDTPGKYTVRYFIESQGPYRNRLNEEYEAWEGQISTPAKTVVVREPEGIDCQVFDAFQGIILEINAGQGPPTILREYPTSTYASYLVWRLVSRGRVLEDTERIRMRMKSGGISNAVPCDKTESECPSNGWMRLRGREYLEWRIRWLRKAIQQHPKMWFTDENRLQLAIDLYMLGNQETGLAELATLKETASVVAVKAKAREILKAIRANE